MLDTTLNFKAYTSADYSIIHNWWVSHGWTPVPEDLLPKTGFIIHHDNQAVASGFIYITDSRFAVLEWVLSDKKSDKIVRDKALDLLILQLVAAAKEQGARTIFTTAQHPGLIERYKRLGFIETDKNMTVLIGNV